MNCAQTEKISLLIDGELPPSEVRAVERHLVGCEACQSARADFLLLRSQIADYSTLLDPLVSQRALAQVISRRGPATQNARALIGSSRGAVLDAFRKLGFNPALATIALFLIAGTVALVLYLAQQDSHDIASLPQQNEQAPPNVTAAAAPSPIVAVNESSNKTGSGHQVADNSRRKSLKGETRETGPNQRKPGSRIKPTRERSSPKPLPQPFSAAPPTYASTNDRAVPVNVATVLAADSETLTARHLEQSELLLRAFRNIRVGRKGVGGELSYERKRAQELVNQNIMLRREADAAGDVQVATLLGSLEPILLDIANLRDKPRNDEVRTIKDRVERQSLVALLQVNSVAVAHANE